MPFGARTTPSSRRVLTCKPAFPGGRFLAAAAPACSRPIKDSKGSRLGTLRLTSGPATAVSSGFLRTAGFFAAGLFVADLTAGGADGFAPVAVGLTGCPTGALDCTVGLAAPAVGAAGFAPVAVGLTGCPAGALDWTAGLAAPAVGAAGFAVEVPGACACLGCPLIAAVVGVAFALPGATGLSCARKPLIVTASKIASASVVRKLIVRSLRSWFPRRLRWACTHLTRLGKERRGRKYRRHRGAWANRVFDLARLAKIQIADIDDPR